MTFVQRARQVLGHTVTPVFRGAGEQLGAAETHGLNVGRALRAGNVEEASASSVAAGDAIRLALNGPALQSAPREAVLARIARPLMKYLDAHDMAELSGQRFAASARLMGEGNIDDARKMASLAQANLYDARGRIAPLTKFA